MAFLGRRSKVVMHLEFRGDSFAMEFMATNAKQEKVRRMLPVCSAKW